MSDDDQINVKDESESNNGRDKDIESLEKEPAEGNVMPSEDMPAKRKTRKLRYVTLFLILIAISVVSVLLFKKDSALTPDKISTDSHTQPDASKPSEETAVSGKIKAGKDALREGRFAEAVVLFEDVFTNEPVMKEKIILPYSQALQGQADILMEKEPQEAKSILLKAVKLNPDSIKGRFQLGLLYTRLKDYPKAIETYEKVGEMDPQHPDTFFNLGYIYALSKDYSKAEKMYSQVVKLAPSYLDEALFNLAMVQRKQGKEKESIGSLKWALEVNPNNELAHKYLQRAKE